MEMNLSGYLTHVGELQELTTQDGSTFTKREIVVKTQEQYPESVLLELSGDNATNFNGVLGQPIRVSYHMSARKGTNGRYFNSIRAWRYSLS